MPDQPTNAYLEALRAEARAKGGYATPVQQSSASMTGTGYAGNYVSVIPQPPDSYAVGDDIVFKRTDGSTTIHRIKYTKPGYVFTQGTFNRNGDGWIPMKQVLGKVTKLVDSKTGQTKQVDAALGN